MDSFMRSLEELKTLNPNDAMGQIFRFFQSINQMDRDTIIAAHQALDLFCHRTGQEIRRGDMDRVRKAIVGRMVNLASEKNGDEREGMIRAFFLGADVNPGYFRTGPRE